MDVETWIHHKHYAFQIQGELGWNAFGQCVLTDNLTVTRMASVGI